MDTRKFSPAFRQAQLREEMAPGARKILLYVGRLAPEKRLDVLMEAFSRVRKAVGPEVALALVGDGPWMDCLKHRAGLAAGARAVAETRSWASILDGLLADYEDALAERHLPAPPIPTPGLR